MKIAELKDNLSRYLRAVENGATVEVTDRERAIARIVPVAASGVTMMPAKYSFATIRDEKYPPVDPSFDIVDLLLQERGER